MNSRSSCLHEQSHTRGEGQRGGLHGMERQARPLDDGRPELARQEGLLRLMAASPRLQRQCACGAPSAAGGSCAACEEKPLPAAAPLDPVLSSRPIGSRPIIQPGQTHSFDQRGQQSTQAVSGAPQFDQARIVQRQETTEATVTEDHLDRFHTDPALILNAINPQAYCQLNCPATADAFENFVRTGRVDAAHCDRDAELRGDLGYAVTGHLIGPYHVALDRRSRGRGLEQFGQRVERLLRAHGDVLVVEAERTGEQRVGRSGRRLSQHHYFVIVNIRGVLFIVDAYQRVVHRFAALTRYLNDLNVSFLRYVRADFSVVPLPR